MILVYIAGPFSAPTRKGVEANVAHAVLVAIEVARIGAMPVCPHANTSHPEFEHVQPYQFWIDGTMELMRRCDVVLMTFDWQRSNGATIERSEAIRLGKPVFYNIKGLAAWLENEAKSAPQRYCAEGDGA